MNQKTDSPNYNMSSLAPLSQVLTDKGIGWPCGAYVVMRSPVISAIFLSNRCSRVDVSGVVNRKDVNSVWERRMLRKFGW
jgi:hypothetical protein